MYKYDLGHILCMLLLMVVVEKLYKACNRERERERGRCLHLVTATACGEEEDKGSLPLCVFFDIVFLSYSVFCSPWAVVVFPIIVGFPRYILCLNFVLLFSVHFVRTSSFRLWLNELGNRILTENTEPIVKFENRQNNTFNTTKLKRLKIGKNWPIQRFPCLCPLY